MATKYLDNTGLAYFWGKIKNYVANLLSSKADDSSVVHLAGAETVSGMKTFSSGLAAPATAYTEASLRSDSDSSAVRIWGGNTRTASAKMILAGTSFATAGYAGCFFFQAPSSGNTAKELKGAPDGTLTWNGQAIQTSSDERIKTLLAVIPDAVLDAWGDVQWGQFRFLDAVERKGDAARLHLGLIAQKVKAVFEKHGLDACAYGILCHEEHEVAEDSSASDLWMVRYEEAQAMEAAYQRRRADRLEARIALLEERLSAFEAEDPK